MPPSKVLSGKKSSEMIHSVFEMELLTNNVLVIYVSEERITLLIYLRPYLIFKWWYKRIKYNFI